MADVSLQTLITDVVDLPTASTDTTKYLGPDGAGGLALTVPAGGGGGGGLLAYVGYDPGGSETTYTTISATLVDVDATNLAITFTAPASGNVLIIATMVVAAASDVAFGLRESTTIIGSHPLVSATTAIIRGVAHIYVSGISSGSHTYKLAWMTEGGGTATIYYNGTFRGPITLEVWSAP